MIKRGKNNISKIAMRAMGIRISCVIVIVSFLAFWQNYQGLKERYQVEVKNYIKERAERESIHLTMAQNNLAAVAKRLKEELNKDNQNYAKEFDRLFYKRKDGIYRERVLEDSGPNSVIAYMKRGVPMTEEMKKTFVILHNLLGEFGQAWRNNYKNIWAVGIEDYTLTFWPTYPKEVIANFPLDYSFIDQEYMTVGLPENNPTGKPAWAGPYQDEATRQWDITITHPIYHNGKFLLAIGMDIFLSDFFKRSKFNVMEGTYNVVISKDGRLISHPDHMEKIRSLGGKFYVQQHGSKELQELYERVKNSKTPVFVDEENDAIVGIAKIQGPEWYMILVQPLSILRAAARKTTNFLIIVGLLSLLVELLMLFQVIQKYVARPIKKLIAASDKMAAGDRDARVSIDSDNEIGHLGTSFNAMAEKVQHRDELLQNQAANLEVEVEKRTNELDVERARTYQASKLITLGEFAGGVSHEINNPLSTILLNTGAMKRKLKRDNINPEEMFAYLDKIEATSNRISKIVKGLNAVSKDAELDRIQTVEVKSLIENTLTLCEETLKGHSVKMECDEIPDRLVLCREVQITQVLIALIQNAIDALEQTQDRKIQLHFNEADDHFIIVVEDNGPGIPKEIQDKIMNPFFTTKELGKGTGLGLFTAYGMVKSNQGNLSFNSAPGCTRFLITLRKSA